MIIIFGVETEHEVKKGGNFIGHTPWWVGYVASGEFRRKAAQEMGKSWLITRIAVGLELGCSNVVIVTS